MYIKGCSICSYSSRCNSCCHAIVECHLPQVIGWSSITYCQAAGIFILARLLFGKFGRPGDCRKCCSKEKEHKQGQIQEKLQHMSPEESREYIRSQMSRHKKYWCNDIECEDLEDGADITK